ncbi:hypothetical protein TWF751_006091 [Orbilia oligospora]|nr:hypothetical protein TWF751_006091 [Orbilia oligospora]
MMTGLDESGSTQASNATSGNEMEPITTPSTNGITHPTTAIGSNPQDTAVAPNPVDTVPPSEGESISRPPPPGESAEVRDTGIPPGQSLVDHPPPALIEKISLADETTTPPSGQLHERYAKLS